MKRFFSLLALLVMIVTTGGYVYAGDVYTLSYDTNIEQSTPGFFTITGSANTRYGGAIYNGKTYATGLKFDSKASIQFTSTAKSTLTIVQSLAPEKKYDNDFKLDGKNLGKDNRVDDTQNKIGIYTISGLESGTHTITKGTSEAGIIFVKVEYEETKPIASTDIELTGVKINGNDLVASDFSNLMANKSLTLTDTYTTTPDVVFVQTTTYNYTDGTSSNKVDNVTADVIKGEDNFIATATINGIQYTITLPINKDVTVEAPTHVAVNGTVALSCATEGASISYKIGDGEYQEYTRPFTILDEDATVSAKAYIGEIETACEPFTVEAVKNSVKTKTVILKYSDFDLVENEEGQSNALLNGKIGTDAEGYTLELNNNAKNYSNGSDITINGKKYKSIKGSNGAENILHLPEGVKVARIVLYSYVNASAKDGAPEAISGWTTVNGKQEYESIPMAPNAIKDPKNPDVRVYPLDNATGTISFNNAGYQLCFVVALDIVETLNVSLSPAGMGTFSSTAAYKLPEGLTAYTATCDGSNVTLKKVEDGIVAANQGVVLCGEKNGKYVLTPTAAAATTTDWAKNALKNTAAEAYTIAPEETNVYVLVCNSNNKGQFARLNGGQTIPVGKAYLALAGTTEAKTLSLSFGDETTGINNVETVNAENNAYYTLSGQKTLKPAKGLYIHNGKKYIAK